MVQQGDDFGATSSAERQGLRLGGGAIASLSSVAALVVFMVQNTNDVTVTFLFWEFTWPVWLLILVSAGIGPLVWFGWWWISPLGPAQDGLERGQRPILHRHERRIGRDWPRDAELWVERVDGRAGHHRGPLGVEAVDVLA